MVDLPPRGQWLEIAGAEVERVIGQIVSTMQQARYGEAAALAVCRAEASAGSGGEEQRCWNQYATPIRGTGRSKTGSARPWSDRRR